MTFLAFQLSFPSDKGSGTGLSEEYLSTVSVFRTCG